MDFTILCAVIASLRVLPNRSQFFQYESFSLSCGEQGKSSQWRVLRNTSTHINEECPTSSKRRNESNCFIHDVYPSDTGVYWCESGAGECSDAVNITVTAGPVILESPVRPVMEGDNVTLSCTKTNTTTSSSNLTTDFYKNGFLVATSSTRNMTIHRVSKSDEGLYKCNISGVGESPDSWLTVRVGQPEPPQSLLILLPVVGFCLLLASLMLLFLWRSYKGKVDTDVSYTDVIITQEVEPKRIRDVDATMTYSTIKPGST